MSERFGFLRYSFRFTVRGEAITDPQQQVSPYRRQAANGEPSGSADGKEMMTLQMPIWFRPYVWIPLMAMLYVVFPLCILDFSPHVLTHSMPYFLVGGSDWGGGNVFAFTKLAYWISLIAGAVATCRVSIVSQTRTFTGMLRFIFRNYGWHGLSVIALVLAWKTQGSTDVGDLWSLTAYLFAGVVAIVWTATEFEKRGRHAWRLIVCVAIGSLWGLVPIGGG